MQEMTLNGKLLEKRCGLISGKEDIFCRTDGLFCHERAAGDQVHDKKGNRGHNEDAEDAHCDTLDDVLCHRLMPLHSYQ